MTWLSILEREEALYLVSEIQKQDGRVGSWPPLQTDERLEFLLLLEDPEWTAIIKRKPSANGMDLANIRLLSARVSLAAA